MAARKTTTKKENAKAGNPPKAKIRSFYMKNTFKLLGIIALVAVIGFFFVACGGGGDDDGGSSGGGTNTGGGTSYPPSKVYGDWYNNKGDYSEPNIEYMIHIIPTGKWEGNYTDKVVGFQKFNGTHTVNGNSTTLILKDGSAFGTATAKDGVITVKTNNYGTWTLYHNKNNYGM